MMDIEKLIEDLHDNYCPNCGAPMTDEAVDIIMRRLETLYETT